MSPIAEQTAPFPTAYAAAPAYALPAEPADADAGAPPLAFALFIALNALLFIRPMELSYRLQGLPIYESLIVLCFAVSFPVILKQLTTRSLIDQPITACVVGLLPVTVIAGFCNPPLVGESRSLLGSLPGFEFAKVVLFYLMFVGIINTEARLRQYLGWLVGFVVVLTVLALLQYHNFIDVEVLRAVDERVVDKATGDETIITRLCSTGIYHDPNDLSLILVVGMAICIYWMGDPRLGLSRLVWLAPLGLFGYGLALTHSRGGFIALLAGLLVLFRARFGWWKAAALAAVVLPVMLVLFGGRQTDIEVSGQNTGQARIQLWRDGLGMLRESPVVGVGPGNYQVYATQVAHNSYIHSFTELGLVGGTLFLGAYLCAAWALVRMGSPQVQVLDPELGRFRPYLMAIVAAYAVGMLTISRNYIVPTYMILGLVACYAGFTPVWPRRPVLRLDLRVLQRMALVSFAFLVFMYVFVRTFAQHG
jgi:O-antigen ligase